jgi:succinyl-CoA synthetase alpha subunit
MAILATPGTRILIQGITGDFGGRHARASIDYRSNVVAGVTPGKGGQVFEHAGTKVPVFDTVEEAAKQTGATAAAVFVPPAFAADAILEGIAARLELIVAITEGIPVNDMMQVKEILRAQTTTRLIGPNCPGLVIPGTGEGSTGGCRIGIAPGHIHRKGTIGVVSRSGTLTYEAVWQLTTRGKGQSTSVGIGGDPVHGLSHTDVLKLFNDDPETEAIVMIGEIGGTGEVDAARWAREHCRKPIAAFIAGATAPPGRRMGHAGAIIGGAEDTAAAKKRILRECGIAVADSPADMADVLLAAMR